MGEKLNPMPVRCKTLAILLLGLFLSAAGLAQELPGGEIHLWPPLVSERGSLPAIVVQTVPDATSTATCLVIRHAEAGKRSAVAGTAHLFEHLLFRTAGSGAPGDLLLRNELLGGSSRAWVTPTTVVFSDLVPSDEGLESLKIQLARLREVPDDKEGLELEKAVLKRELVKIGPEEEGRREILRSLGYEPQQEGKASTLPDLKARDLDALLQNLDLQEDAVIAVVGPQTDREVRKFLSANLRPLGPKRTQPREPSVAVNEPKRLVEIDSPSGYDQRSYFLTLDPEDAQALRSLADLLEMRLPGRVRLQREDDALWRLDVKPWDTDPAAFLSPPTDQELTTLSERSRTEWLDRYESVQSRAEMLALATLRGDPISGPATGERLSQLLARARLLLPDLLEASNQLIVRPQGPTTTNTFYDFKMRANRDGTQDVRKLPNSLGVTVYPTDSWPITAVSGFFRISPPLSSLQATALQNTLDHNPDLLMEYEVLPDGLFFHYWAPSEETIDLLKASAQELKTLAGKNIVVEPETSNDSVIDTFFLPPPSTDESTLKGAHLINPKLGHLVVVGQFTPEQLDEGLRPAWSGWFGPRSAAGFRKPEVGQPAGAEVKSLIVDSPPGSTPVLVLGFTGPARRSPDFLAFNLGVQTLAGRPSTSILARRLESGPHAVSSVKVFPLSASYSGEERTEQTWVIALRLSHALSDPAPVVKTVEELIRGLGTTTLAEADLERTRQYLKSSLTLSASTVRGRARVLAHSEFYRLSESYADDFAGLYDHLDPRLVKAVCGKYLEKPALRWLYFRPGKEKSAPK